MPDGWFPGGQRQIIGGENDSEPAEYVIEPDTDYGLKVTTLVQLEPIEIEQIAENGYLILTMWGGELPWSIRPAPNPESEWTE